MLTNSELRARPPRASRAPGAPLPLGLPAPLPLALLFFATLAVTACALVGRGGRPVELDESGCLPDNGGISLPEGFCALVVADGLGGARHLVVRDDGDVFVAVRDRPDRGGVVALRDTTGDGRADVRATFGTGRGVSGIALDGEFLFVSTDDAVLRYRLQAGSLTPVGRPDTLVRGMPADRGHRTRSLALLGDALFVNVGSATNSCQVEERVVESPGVDPCPELATRAGIWRVDVDRTGQLHTESMRFATGIRNAVALAGRRPNGGLYAVVHGRDQLYPHWPGHYTPESSAENPSEEFIRIEEADDFGWPYCYHDPQRNRLLLSPEYGGDAESVGRCADAKEPLFGFPAHWAPDALLFYDGEHFPARYQGGAFVAFHGSWNRAPFPQGGYNLVFLPLDGDSVAGPPEVFADGFAGPVKEPRQARHRPTGLAQGSEGSLYVSENVRGRVWRIRYIGGEPAP